MATTNLKKSANGYSYKYTDLASIHDYLESVGYTYRQYTETEPANGNDYIWTVPIDAETGKEEAPIRGAKITGAKLQGKANEAQEMGAAITYARRYSLLMAFGLATTDDDARVMTQYEPTAEGQQAEARDRKGMEQEFKKLIAHRGVTERDVLKRANVQKLGDMPIQQLDNCLAWLADDGNWVM